MELYKEELSFFFHYVKGVNRKALKEALDKVSSLEELEQFKEELDEFYSLMPGKEDIESYNKDEVYSLLDVRNPDKSKRNTKLTTSHIGGDPAIIRQSLAKKKWYYELLKNRINELNRSAKSLDNQEESKSNKLSFTKEDVYNFLDTNFKMDVTKESFMSEDNYSSIVISGSFKKLYRNELTKYMIGYLFEYLFDNFSELKARVMFKYIRRGGYDTILFSEAIKALNDTKRLISQQGASDKNLKQFQDNLEKEFSLFINKNH